LVVNDDAILQEAISNSTSNLGNRRQEPPNNGASDALSLHQEPLIDEDRAVYLLVRNMKWEIHIFPYGDFNYPITIKWTGETRNGVPHGVGTIVSDQSSCPHNNFKGIAYMTNGKLTGPMNILDKDGITRCHDGLTDERVSGRGREYQPEDPAYFRRQRVDPNLKGTCFLNGEYQGGLAHGHCKYTFDD
jgi:hypothetical protein